MIVPPTETPAVPPPGLPLDRSRPIAAIGDVHGMTALLESELEKIDAAGAFPVLLGDLTDKGPDSLGVLRLVLPRLRDGTLALVRGNHDDKLLRWLQRPDRDGTPPRAVLDLKEAPDRDELSILYCDQVSAAPLWIALPSYHLVHGAFDAGMRTHTGEQGGDKRLRAKALFAETDGHRTPDGLPVRTYRWVETVPAGLTVVVGHDVRQTHEPLVIDNAEGGRVVFLDTGAHRSGRLSSWIIPAL